MPANPYRDRLFAAAEVRRILRRAAELEDAARPRGAPGGGRGHTREEIERIARDAGISEVTLRRVIDGEGEPAQKAQRQRSLMEVLAGAPGKVSITSTVSGDVRAEDHERLARAMSGAIGELGDAQALGDSLTWSVAAAAGRLVQASVEPLGDGRVAIRVDESMRAMRSTIFTGATVAGFVATLMLIMLIQAQVVPYVMIAWVLFSYAFGRATYARRVHAREAALRVLVNDVASLVETSGPRVALGVTESGGARVAGVYEGVASHEGEGEEAMATEDEKAAPGRRARLR